MFSKQTCDSVINEMFSKARIKFKRIAEDSRKAITDLKKQRRQIDHDIDHNESENIRAEVILERLENMLKVDVEEEKKKRGESVTPNE